MYKILVSAPDRAVNDPFGSRVIYTKSAALSDEIERHLSEGDIRSFVKRTRLLLCAGPNEFGPIVFARLSKAESNTLRFCGDTYGLGGVLPTVRWTESPHDALTYLICNYSAPQLAEQVHSESNKRVFGRFASA